MSNKAPGKHYRKGISLVEAASKFGNETNAETWLIERRWPHGIRCAYCESDQVTNRKSSRKLRQFHCINCKANFSVKTQTIMHDSKLPLSKWALAFYLYSTNLEGVSSMKLHRDLGIAQKSAWHLAHRIRETWDDQTAKMAGPVEADETYIGGKESNKHASKKLHAGRGTIGKTAVAGLKDRKTNKIKTQVVSSTDSKTLQEFVLENTQSDTQLYTDESRSYQGIDRPHGTVCHSVGEFVREQAHTNGIESHWALLKRGYDGIYHQFSVKHLNRYVKEFEGRHNARPLDTEQQMTAIAKRSTDKRLTYRELISS